MSESISNLAIVALMMATAANQYFCSETLVLPKQRKSKSYVERQIKKMGR